MWESNKAELKIIYRMRFRGRYGDTLLFTSEKDGKTVLSAYEKDDKTYEEQAYVLKDTVKEDTDRTEKLSGILAAPMMMAAGFESGSDMTADIEEQLKHSFLRK